MKKFGRVFKYWGKSLQALFTSPRILIPFLIMAFAHIALLYILYFFPRHPVKIVSGPLVRKFFGEVYLHYPFNFIILPYLARIFRQILSISFDFYFIAVLAILGYEYYRKESLEAGPAFRSAIMRFFPLLAYTLILFIIVSVIQKVPPYVFRTIYNSPLVSAKSLETYQKINQIIFYCFKFLGVVIQTFFIYTIPFLVIDDIGLLRSVDRSFRFAFRNFFSSFFLIFVPALIIFGLEQYIKAPKPLIETYYPELIMQISLLIEILNVLFTYMIILTVTGIYTENHKVDNSLVHG